MEFDIREWSGPEEKRTHRGTRSSQHREIWGSASSPSGEFSSVWMNPELVERPNTANLEDQEIPTLYYLGQVVDIPVLVQVYVEKRRDGRLKHWAVLKERDYDAMEEIYDIEEETLKKFPMNDLNFRVTIWTEGGPSISGSAYLVYDAA